MLKLFEADNQGCPRRKYCIINRYVRNPLPQGNFFSTLFPNFNAQTVKPKRFPKSLAILSLLNADT